ARGAGAGARPSALRAGQGARVAVVTRRAVGLGRRIAAVGGLVAHPVVALVRRCAAVAERSPADAIGAAVVHGAEEAVVAERAVGLKRGGAGTGRRITDAGGVAGVDGRTGDAVGAVADPGAAGVDLRAGVAVVAH